jgi:two-component system OmpR family response regulator
MQVLVVEDEPFLADTIRRGLRDHGYSVDVARTGDRGLELALGHLYRGILLDIMLPGMRGDEVLQELRAREIWTPVILLTAKDGEYDRARALELGADDFLAKPFSFVTLLDRLASLTEGRGDAEQSRRKSDTTIMRTNGDSQGSVETRGAP